MSDQDKRLARVVAAIMVALLLALGGFLAWALLIAVPESPSPNSTPSSVVETPPPPEWFEVEISIKAESVEGATIHLLATTNLPDGSTMKAMAWRSYKHHDDRSLPRKDNPRRRWDPTLWDELTTPDPSKAQYISGDVCSDQFLVVKNGEVRWSCEVDDSRWYESATKHLKRTPPLGHVSGRVGVSLRLGSISLQPPSTQALAGPGGQYLKGMCVYKIAYESTCSEQIMVDLPFVEPSGVVDR